MKIEIFLEWGGVCVNLECFTVPRTSGIVLAGYGVILIIILWLNVNHYS